MSKPISIVQDKVHKHMYWLKWKDGVLSEDFYNLTRVKDILANHADYRTDMLKRRPRSELECL